MKNEEELKQYIADFEQKVWEIDFLATIAIRSHLLLEEELDSVLEAIAQNRKHLDLEARFHQKVKWVRAFAPSGDDERWQLVEAVTLVRNKAAHRFAGPEREKALQNLRKIIPKFLPADIDPSTEQTLANEYMIQIGSMISVFLLHEIKDQISKQNP